MLPADSIATDGQYCTVATMAHVHQVYRPTLSEGMPIDVLTALHNEERRAQQQDAADSAEPRWSLAADLDVGQTEGGVGRNGPASGTIRCAHGASKWTVPLLLLLERPL
jgi:hypothetical protein